MNLFFLFFPKFQNLKRITLEKSIIQPIWIISEKLLSNALIFFEQQAHIQKGFPFLSQKTGLAAAYIFLFLMHTLLPQVNFTGFLPLALFRLQNILKPLLRNFSLYFSRFPLTDHH